MPDLRRAALDNDEDIRGERLTLESAQDLRVQASAAGEGIRGLAIGGNPGKGKEVPGTGAITPPQYRHVRLNWYPNSGGHQPNADTRALLKEAGGRDAMLKFTSLFYQKAFADPHLDQFIRDHGDDHGGRFANWITEKFGLDTPWTLERATRKVCPFMAHGHKINTAHDRSSAHFAAWHSPKRKDNVWGDHFNLQDCRTWMRLHFWAMRESGVYEASPSFREYYIKFIGHFVSVYERTAPPFAREAERWSANPDNIKKYYDDGKVMTDLIGLSHQEALRSLPKDEASSAGDWPYC